MLITASRGSRASGFRLAGLLLILWASCLPSAARAEDRVTLVVPAARAGGWDQTAVAMASVLREAGLASQVDITNSPGAGGAIALAQFVHGRPGDGQALLVSGLVMLDAIRESQATVSMLQATPLARLTGEAEVIVVPAGSPFETLGDLLAAMKHAPGDVTWAGGSHGGTDQRLVQLIATAIGVDADSVNYMPSPGGGAGLRVMLDGRATAGVSGYAELASAIRTGKLRALAVSSEQRLDGVAIPTLKEQGVDVALTNWRGLFAPPGLSAGDRARLQTMVERMVSHPAWRRQLKVHTWTDLYLPGDPFVAFVKAEQQRADEAFARTRPASGSRPVTPRSRAAQGPLTIAPRIAAGLTLALGFTIVTGWRWWRRLATRAQARERALRDELERTRQDARRTQHEARAVLDGLAVTIDKQFDTWQLSAAEREIALLMLKGLRHKEIAVARQTSERTVRQQALAVYRKAGLEGRTDLAAFFLEDLLLPAHAPAPASAPVAAT